MELPQARTFGDEDRKRTHDFLSLYSPGQQDPRPSQGSYLKTHDFLQPPEISSVEKPPPSAPPPRPSATHILPGGFGTYSISYHEQRAPEKEGAFSMAAQASSTERNDENSNCSSYSGSGFTLWEESDSKKGKTGKENIVGERLNVKVNSTALSSLSSSQQPIFEKYPSFTKMLTSPKMAEEEDDEEFVVKKEASSHPKGNFAVKVEGRSPDQKPSTPRSKHSATEQRRRCKINDRFQRLREIIPHGDQKRDKASFLLEVIEYVQYLQEKVDRYEGSYQGCNQEPSKLRPWGKRCGYGEGLIEQSHCTSSGSGQAMIFTAKIDDIKTNDVQKLEDHLNVVVLPKERLQKPEFPFNRTFNATEAYSSGVGLDMNKPATQQVQAHFQPRVSTNDAEISDPKLKQQEQQSIENGSINISSVYSQQLLNSLTQALRHSGVDLSQANVDVKIDLGKSAKREVYPSISTYKNDIPMNVSSRAGSRSQTVGTGEEYDEALKKRLKTSRS